MVELAPSTLEEVVFFVPQENLTGSLTVIAGVSNPLISFTSDFSICILFLFCFFKPFNN